VYDTFCWGQPVNSSTVVIEKELWEKVGGFDEAFSFYEDYEFFFRIGLHTKCCVVNKHSGLYMFDAFEQATKKKRQVNRETRPHIAFIDNSIKEGHETSSMIKFAVIQLSLIICGMKDRQGVEDLQSMFPNVFQKCFLLRAFRINNFFVRRILNFSFNLVYRCRCHVIIWRKHAK
jgi:hypothetical protein